MTKLIVGLGNPDVKYQFNRHNAGFMVVDYLAYKLGSAFKNESMLKCAIAKTNISGEQTLLIKPMTYMNLSGDAVIAVMNFYKLQKEDVLVVFDDLDIDFGTIRFKANGSSGGHNGIKSIIRVFGGDNNFDRLKIGIGESVNHLPVESFVLQDFPKDKLQELKNIVVKSSEAIEFYIQNDITQAQNRFN